MKACISLKPSDPTSATAAADCILKAALQGSSAKIEAAINTGNITRLGDVRAPPEQTGGPISTSFYSEEPEDARFDEASVESAKAYVGIENTDLLNIDDDESVEVLGDGISDVVTVLLMKFDDAQIEASQAQAKTLSPLIVANQKKLDDLQESLPGLFALYSGEGMIKAKAQAEIDHFIMIRTRSIDSVAMMEPKPKFCCIHMWINMLTAFLEGLKQKTKTVKDYPIVDKIDGDKFPDCKRTLNAYYLSQQAFQCAIPGHFSEGANASKTLKESCTQKACGSYDDEQAGRFADACCNQYTEAKTVKPFCTCTDIQAKMIPVTREANEAKLNDLLAKAAAGLV